MPRVAALPAQLGGAGGTLASFVELVSAERDRRGTPCPPPSRPSSASPPPTRPGTPTRWPVTELGDALVQAIDALGVFAADVATLARTEIGELAEGVGRRLVGDAAEAEPGRHPC